MQALIEYDRVAAPRERHDSLLDRVTGLPRWELLIDRLEVALCHARRTDGVVTLFLVYVDGAGIPDIVTFADYLRLWLHDGDTLARIGLSDFGILCNDVRTKSDAARHIECGAGVTYQLGCATSRPEHTADDLIREAIANAQATSDGCP